MSVFLKIEKQSNIIGETGMETVLIPVSNIQMINSTSDGGSFVYIKGSDQPIVSNKSVEDLMYKCVVNLADFAI